MNKLCDVTVSISIETYVTLGLVAAASYFPVVLADLISGYMGDHKISLSGGLGFGDSHAD